MNFVTPQAGAKHELLFNEPASGWCFGQVDFFVVTALFCLFDWCWYVQMALKLPPA
jgi:hypothetical protein